MAGATTEEEVRELRHKLGSISGLEEAQQRTSVEGSKAMVERGRESAVANGLADRAEFGVANLFECTPESLALMVAMTMIAGSAVA